MKELKRIFNKYGFELSLKQEKMFEDYFSFLLEENKKMNLTAITEEKEVVLKHFLDSVLPEKFIEKNLKLVDVGSGAGFPAIPLKILRNDLEITMVDSLLKRVKFLKELTEKLNLENTFSFHQRVEDFSKTNREKFDVAVARAVASLNTLLEYLLPLLKVGGKAIIYKSSKLEEELSTAKNALKILGGEVEKIESFKIEENESLRNILIVKKIAKTPLKYPRGKNLPKQTPIV